MSDREHFITTLQACYFGDRNAYNEIVRIYDEKEYTEAEIEAIKYLKEHSITTIKSNFLTGEHELICKFKNDANPQDIFEILDKEKLRMSNEELYNILKIKDSMIDELIKKLDNKENIIKEVREYIDEHAKWDYSGGTWEEHSAEWHDLDVTVSMFIRELLEILDKENKE